MPKTRPHRTAIAPTLVSLMGLVLCASPIQVLAQPSNSPVQPSTRLVPPSSQARVPTPTLRRRAGRRKPASARGPCSPSEESLTALIPETNVGLTVRAYPTFFVYMPQTPATTAEFVLLDEETNERVYQTTLPISGTPGLIRVSLPASKTLRPLEVGKDYHWYLSIICDPGDPSRGIPRDASGDIYVDGWVRRVEADPTLIHQLEKASPGERAALYQKDDLWYDALETLVEQRRLHPDHLGLAAEWATLLKSVGLVEIAQYYPSAVRQKLGVQPEVAQEGRNNER